MRLMHISMENRPLTCLSIALLRPPSETLPRVPHRASQNGLDLLMNCPSQVHL
jgi:hypothetical protein